VPNTQFKLILLTLVNIFLTILGFIAFSFGTSFIYIINDLKDIEKDKLHERKKQRPLASGKIKKKNAIIIAIISLILSLTINYIATKSFFNITTYLLLSYIISNILYTYYFKNIVIIDVAFLSLGFILRTYYGASLINIEVSDWLFLTIMSGSLFLGLGKRKKELINNINIRHSLKNYNELFLDKFQYTTLTLTILFYSLWSMEQVIVYTIPIIILIFMRYCLIIETNNEGDPTTVFYSDKLLIVLCLIYTIIMTFILVI